MQPTTAEQKKQTGRWSREEHERFMLGLMNYGKNWKKVQEIVGTRSGSQVRSHAQKFFNKIQRCSKEPKSRNSANIDPNLSQNHEQQCSFTQNNDIYKSMEEHSMVTPPQLITLIKKQSVDNRKVNLSSFRKSLEENEQKVKQILGKSGQESFLLLKNNNLAKGQQAEGENPLSAMPLLNSFKSMNNIISAYEALNQTDPHNQFEDESFLIGLTKKYKKFFSKGGHFENLIDFGNPHEVEKAAEIQRGMRKKSWTLAEGFQGDEHDLEDIKQKLKQVKRETAQKKIEAGQKQAKNKQEETVKENTQKQEQPKKQQPVKPAYQTSNIQLSPKKHNIAIPKQGEQDSKQK